MLLTSDFFIIIYWMKLIESENFHLPIEYKKKLYNNTYWTTDIFCNLSVDYLTSNWN